MAAAFCGVAWLLASATLWSQAPPPDWQTHMQRAQGALVHGDLPAAEREFREVLKIDAENAEAHANLGSIYYLRKDWAAASEQLESAISKRPELWKARTLLALCNRRIGDEKRAREGLTAALPHLEAGPFKTNAEIELTESLYKAGDLDGAQMVLGQAEREAPRNPDVLYIAYRLYTDLANLARDQLRLVAPDSGRMHQLTAQHLVNRGDLIGAIREYEAALKADPRLRGVHYELGEAFVQQSPSPESLRDAEQEFRDALKEDPSNANAEAQLGLIELLRANTEQAMTHFKRAFALDPENALAEQGMGKALVHLDRALEALPYLEKAVQANPENTDIHYQLAMVYRKLGRKADADREFSTFQKLQQSSRMPSGR
jgi:tetratricopeptide (TPR) repeat protein